MTLNGEGSLAPGQHTLVLPTAPSLSRSLEPEFQGAPVVMRVVVCSQVYLKNSLTVLSFMNNSGLSCSILSLT